MIGHKEHHVVLVFPQGIAVVAGLVAVEAGQSFVEVGALYRHVAGMCDADVDQVEVVFNVVGASGEHPHPASLSVNVSWIVLITPSSRSASLTALARCSTSRRTLACRLSLMVPADGSWTIYSPLSFMLRTARVAAESSGSAVVGGS